MNGFINAQEAHCIAEYGHFPMIDHSKALWFAVVAAIGRANSDFGSSVGPPTDLMEAN